MLDVEHNSQEIVKVHRNISILFFSIFFFFLDMLGDARIYILQLELRALHFSLVSLMFDASNDSPIQQCKIIC